MMLTLSITAFILYRQHHQATTVAQHPGLGNPEISKVLGKQWSTLPDHTKKKWQALAEVSWIDLIIACAPMLTLPD